MQYTTVNHQVTEPTSEQLVAARGRGREAARRWLNRQARARDVVAMQALEARLELDDVTAPRMRAYIDGYATELEVRSGGW